MIISRALQWIRCLFCHFKCGRGYFVDWCNVNGGWGSHDACDARSVAGALDDLILQNPELDYFYSYEPIEITKHSICMIDPNNIDNKIWVKKKKWDGS